MANKKPLKSNCDEEGGKLMPLVNFNSCGAKEDCVAVCPYDVFEIRPITIEDKAKLNMKGKIKTFFFKEHALLLTQANPEKKRKK